MKLLTVTVPCYNSAEYMEKCIDSLLPGGDRVEVIIIDDGSKDNTGAIADAYAEKYPNIVRVIHQENGGLDNVVHGAAVAFQNGGNVGQGLLGLFAGFCGHSAGSRVNGQLTGNKGQTGCVDALGIGTDGCGCFFGAQYVLHDFRSSFGISVTIFLQLL